MEFFLGTKGVNLTVWSRGKLEGSNSGMDIRQLFLYLNRDAGLDQDVLRDLNDNATSVE
jgi:hypothetical protein